MPAILDPSAWLLAWARVAAPVLARALGLSWTAPALGMRGLGWRIRLGLALLLTALLTPVVGAIPAPSGGGISAVLPAPRLAMEAPWNAGTIALARICLAELATGAALGLAMGLVLAAARLAGEVVGMQAGLSVAGLLDPGGGVGGDGDVDPGGLSPMGRLYGLIALATFLALDGPLRLVGALIESYHVVPPGGLPLSIETAEAAFGRVGWALGLALRAAAPAGLALALAGLALGLLARAATGLQLLSLSLPIRAALGVLLVGAGLVAAVAAFEGAWLDALQFMAISNER